MESVKSVQHAAPRSNSSGYTNRDWAINCGEFVAQKKTLGESVNISVFFPTPSGHQQGIGLSFGSPEAAKAVARALLTVAGGSVDEIRGHFAD